MQPQPFPLVAGVLFAAILTANTGCSVPGRKTADVAPPTATAEPERVGKIIIEGNTVTDRRVILNQLQLVPGQVLDRSKIEKAPVNLARLGIFDATEPPTVEVLPSDTDANFRDIRVRVKETRTGMVALAVGLNSWPGPIAAVSSPSSAAVPALALPPAATPVPGPAVGP
ncbi:MAG: POTRA domain-containing protein [Fimbriiglobus sp.]